LGYWFTREERSLAMAITDAAAKFSTAIGVPLIGLLLLYVGWRWSFAATGFISFLYFVLFYSIYRNPGEDKNLSPQELQFIRQGGAQPEDDIKAQPGSSLGYLLKQRKVYGLALGWGAYNYTFFLLLTWLPSYLSVSLHMDLFHSIFYTSVPWLFATFTDLLVGGWLVDAMIQRGYDANRVRQSVLVTGMIFGLAIFGAASAHSPVVALVWISLALGGLAASAPVAWTVPSLISPKESVGTLAGAVNLCGQIAAISAPIVTGYIVSASHSFAAAFVTATVILLLGIVGYVFVLGRIEPIPEPPSTY
jgi:ACS family D-galactonate transporter-like MFS transporter